jgi:hypothetical protein
MEFLIPQQLTAIRIDCSDTEQTAVATDVCISEIQYPTSPPVADGVPKQEMGGYQPN